MSILVSLEWPVGLSLDYAASVESCLSSGSSLENPSRLCCDGKIMCVCVWGAETWLCHVARPQAAALEMPPITDFRTACPDLKTLKSHCTWPPQCQIMGRNNAESDAGFWQTLGVFVCLCVCFVL